MSLQPQRCGLLGLLGRPDTPVRKPRNERLIWARTEERTFKTHGLTQPRLLKTQTPMDYMTLLFCTKSYVYPAPTRRAVLYPEYPDLLSSDV